MKYLYLFFAGLVFLPMVGYGQINPERTALNRLDKEKWSTASRILEKALQKDSLNAEAWYLMSILHFTPDYAHFSIDSAHHFEILAEQSFQLADDRGKERMSRLPLDHYILGRHHERIDSAAFEKAKSVNTEGAYVAFISKYPHASAFKAAVELRDEVSFLDALRINTAEGYLSFLKKYPVSHRSDEATMRYNELLFKSGTQDGKLESYLAFLKEHPTTPHRPEAEKNIFEIATASGLPETFEQFIKNYPDSETTSRAIDILYHIDRSQKVYPFYNDSLRHVRALDTGYWVPVLRDGKFGFMNENGIEVMKPRFATVPDEYLCGNIETTYLIFPEGILARDGTWIFTDDFQQVNDLGAGFLFIIAADQNRVIHKSGFTVYEGKMTDARLILDNFVAIQESGKWAIFSLAGKLLVPFEADDIYALDEIVVIVKSGKRIVTSIQQLGALANKNPLPESLVFDDVRWIASDWYNVRNGALEGVLNASLEFIVPLDRQILTRAPIGFVRERNKRLQTVGVSQELDRAEFESIQFYGNWIKLKNDEGTGLYDLPSRKMSSQKLDSLWFDNRMAFTKRADSVDVHFLSGKMIGFPTDAGITFIKSPDSVEYFYTVDKTKKVVYSITSGAQLFNRVVDDIEYIGQSTFLATEKGKKGLLAMDGSVLVPAEYSAIVRIGSKYVSLLKDGKFGFYDLVNRILIKPEYERNLTLYNDSLLVAYKEGAYGFINWRGSAVSAFEFAEVKQWNDTSAMVKKNFEWMIYGIGGQKIHLRGIRNFNVLSDWDDEVIAMVFRENYYGILSNTRGEVVPASFTYIQNVGSQEIPLYFTEKHVEEASIYIVIYYDREGKLLLRQIFEEDEYERIRCD